MQKEQVFHQLSVMYDGYEKAWLESVDDDTQRDEFMTTAVFINTMWFSYLDEHAKDDGSVDEAGVIFAQLAINDAVSHDESL